MFCDSPSGLRLFTALNPADSCRCNFIKGVHSLVLCDINSVLFEVWQKDVSEMGSLGIVFLTCILYINIFMGRIELCR